MEIKRFALFLRALAWIGAALVLVRPILGVWVSLVPFTILSDAQIAEAMAGPPSGRLMLTALMLPPYLSIAWGLAQLAGFCTQLAREQHFTGQAARTLSKLGWAIVSAALLLPATRLLALMIWVENMSLIEVLLAVLRLPTIISVTMGLIFGTIIIIFSALLGKSIALQDENSSFV